MTIQSVREILGDELYDILNSNRDIMDKEFEALNLTEGTIEYYDALQDLYYAKRDLYDQCYVEAKHKGIC